MSSEKSPSTFDAPVAAALALKVAAQIPKVGFKSLQRLLPKNNSLEVASTRDAARICLQIAQHLLANPSTTLKANATLAGDLSAIALGTFFRRLGVETPPVREPDRTDRRFRHDAWSDYALFDAMKEAYLAAGDALSASLSETNDVAPDEARKLRFYARQLVDALAPANFLLSNPEALLEAWDSRGLSLLKGLSNFLDDLDRGDGRLRIRMTDESKFKLGVNIATTPGKIVYQNELMQLIQYAPTTETAYSRPLLIVPPWINKYYILDLQREKSFVRWAVEQGHAVFVISWINPDETLADKKFEDYMTEGILAALDAIKAATGENAVNAIGYCIGGTLLAATLGFMHATEDTRIESATYFVSLVDFAEPGELGVFIDREQLARLDSAMEKRGYLDGASMAGAFNLLRANDLIWSYVVNNYLLGKDPPPFDLLYWNADSTRMPCAMHSYYLRNMYLKNALSAGKLELSGKRIDLTRISTPTYIVSTREDHIAPWQSTYEATRLYAGPIRFVLGGSGHIAGIINPPGAEKYGFWTNAELPANADAWFKGATQTTGSWWLDWQNWVSQHGGKKVPAREPGQGELEALEDAPGSYVRVRSEG